jgi:hypothetical protein
MLMCCLEEEDRIKMAAVTMWPEERGSGRAASVSEWCNEVEVEETNDTSARSSDSCPGSAL